MLPASRIAVDFIHFLSSQSKVNNTSPLADEISGEAHVAPMLQPALAPRTTTASAVDEWRLIARLELQGIDFQVPAQLRRRLDGIEPLAPGGEKEL